MIGFDGKKIRLLIDRTGKKAQPHWFEGLLGVGITINDYEQFVKKYDELLESLFKKEGLIRNKTLYKGSDLVAIFYGKGINLIPGLIEELLKLIDFVDIYFHDVPEYFDENAQITNRIGVYYEEEIEHLTNVKFIDLIQNHFPALCCCSYLKNLESEVKDTIYCIDDCSPLLQSKATIEIIKHPNTRFLFRGDQVNFAVNVADIFCKYLEDRITKEKIRIEGHLIKNLGLPEDKTEYHYINQKWLYIIKPARRAILNINHKYPHPVYIIFTDAQSAFKNAKDVIENSVLFREALKKASVEGGSVKFFEAQDQDYITEQDFLITHTENTDKKIKELKRMGCPAKMIDIDFFTKK